MIKAYEVDEYKARIFSRARSKNSIFGPRKMEIRLYSAGNLVAFLFFFVGDDGLESDGINSSGSLMHLSFYESEFDRVLDLLRNEKPVWAKFSKTSGETGEWINGIGEISTQKEDVGEEETKWSFSED